MAYQVVYEQGRGKRKREREKSYVLPMTLAAFLLFVFLVKNQWPEGHAVLREMIPGDAAQIGETLEVFAGELRAGEPFPQALEAFCQEVLFGTD